MIPYKFMARRIRLLLLIPHLGGGGAEKIIALLARKLSRHKYELHLVLVTQADCGGADLPPWIIIHPFGAARVRYSAWRLLRLVWRLRPDVILSGIAHLNFLVLLLRPLMPRRTHILVRQNGTVSTTLSQSDLPCYTRLLYRLLYRHADRVICQSSAMAEDLTHLLGMQEGPLTVLPNPIDCEEIKAAVLGQSSWTGSGPHLLAVGRLAPEKGFDLLLEALHVVRERFPHADLVLAGTGPQEAVLKAQCRALGLDAAVRFAGYIDPPYQLYPGTTAFVLSSRQEGMPNALLEALCAGLPVVALPSSGGVADLLRDRPGAWLAAEISSPALAAAIVAALDILHSTGQPPTDKVILSALV